MGAWPSDFHCEATIKLVRGIEDKNNCLKLPIYSKMSLTNAPDNKHINQK